MTKRIYTHSIVSYASLEEIKPLLDTAKQWAYICHDRDKADNHYHIIAYFNPSKTFSAVTKLVKSNQNTFSQEIHGSIEDILDYFTHEGKDDKEQYSPDDIVYSDKEYWNKRKENNPNDEYEKNESFIMDLMDKNFSLMKMATLYGKDFIRYHESYLRFRELLLEEQRNESKTTDRH